MSGGRPYGSPGPVGVILRAAVLIVVLLVTLLPIAWIVLTSFKPQREWVSDPPVWIPSEWTVESYEKMWDDGGGRVLLNSAVIVTTSTVAAMLIGCLAAYSFSRFRTGGRHIVTWILSVKFLPPVVFAVPLLIMFTNNGLYDRWLGLILLYTTFQLPFVVWMMKGFFDEIPVEYEEAAMIDGYSRLEAIWKIVIPEAIPAMAATAVFSAIVAWNEFVLANLLNRDFAATVPPWLNSIIGVGAVEWGRLAAASVVFVIPIVVFTFLVRNYLLRGVTFGAVRR